MENAWTKSPRRSQSAFNMHGCIAFDGNEAAMHQNSDRIHYKGPFAPTVERPTTPDFNEAFPLKSPQRAKLRLAFKAPKQTVRRAAGVLQFGFTRTEENSDGLRGSVSQGPNRIQPKGACCKGGSFKAVFIRISIAQSVQQDPSSQSL